MKPGGLQQHQVLEISTFFQIAGWQRAAFTLIELLTVIAIMGVFAAMAVPSGMSALRGFRLNSGARVFVNQLKYARQVAITRNQSVEIRFYKYIDSDMGNSNADAGSGEFRALQLFELTASGTNAGAYAAIGKVVRLPSTVILDKGQTLSSIIPSALQSGNFSIPRVGTNYSYFKIRYLANGATDLPNGVGLQFMTLHDIVSGDALTQAPTNYCTIQIDPSDGHLKTFRP